MDNSTRAAVLLAGVLMSLVSASGSRAADQTLRVDSVVLRPLQAAEVPAQQVGLLQQISVVEGQRVAPGDLLASLDIRDARLAVARAEIEQTQAEAKAKNEVHIRYAEKALDVARAELRRSNESLKKFPKSISQSQVDVERLTVEKLVLEREQAELEISLAKFDLQLTGNQLRAAQLRLEQHQLRAPFAGTVALIRGQVGEWVEIGAPVLRLVAVDALRAEGFLSADLASTSLVGKKAEFLVAPEKKVAGILRFVSPEIDPVSRQVRVWAEIPNPRHQLRPGQQGSLIIIP